MDRDNRIHSPLEKLGTIVRRILAFQPIMNAILVWMISVTRYHCRRLCRKKLVSINKSLPVGFQRKIEEIIQSYEVIFTDVPGKMSKAIHKIVLTVEMLINVRQYNLPLHYKEAISKELEEFLRIDII